MGEFSDSPKWTLINDFTIHEDEAMRDRPRMLTCVPKSLSIEVTCFEVLHHVEWPEHLKDQEPPRAYANRTFIKFDARLHDRITIFDMQEGEVATFREISGGTIRALTEEHIGGAHNATSFEGISHSGFSSKEVPAKGLMEDEPGHLSFIPEYEERDGRSVVPQTLYAGLYMDPKRFRHLVELLANPARPIQSIRIQLLAELFESEVSAALSEPWMSCDYGMLRKRDAAHAAARIDSINISSGAVSLEIDRDDGLPDEDMDALATGETQSKLAWKNGLSALMAEQLRFQKLTFAGIRFLIAISLIL